jgi:hypothetical protein
LKIRVRKRLIPEPLKNRWRMFYMNLEPVRKYNEPKYPVKNMVLENPALLKTVPGRWKDNVYVGAALSTLLMFTLTSCVSKNNPGVDTPGGTSGEKAAVAPIFEHGSGRGSFGCVSIAPPSFLSEEEAFQVIDEEARKYGISFTKDSLVLEGVGIPETKFYSNLGKPEEKLVKGSRKGSLTLDGLDSSKEIGFEFISESDYRAWKVKENMDLSVDSYDFLSTAKVLKKGLEKKNGKTTIGIFYDPMTEFSKELLKELDKIEDFKDKSDFLKERSEEHLRNQVKDFLGWLKAQGIL